MNLKNNTKIISLTIATGLVLFLFLLPRTVVSKKANKEQTMVEKSTKEIEENSSAHLDLDEKTIKEIEKINLLLKKADTKEKIVTFAGSLMEIYQKAKAFDSVAKYADVVVNAEPSVLNKQRAAEAWLTAFEVMPPSQKALPVADRAIALLSDLEKSLPSDLNIKAMKAYLIMNTNPIKKLPPMEGMQVLKQIIEKNPNHYLSNKYLGEFYLKRASIDPEFMDKAILYLKTAFQLKSDDIKVCSLLLDAYIAKENKVEAEKILEKFIALADKKDKFLQDFILQKQKEVKKL